MELETLLKKRDAYGKKMLKLGLQIAGIFLIPILIIYAISQLFDIRFIYLFPVAFVSSWIGVVILYRKISKEVKLLETRIRELRAKELSNDVTSTSETTKL